MSVEHAGAAALHDKPRLVLSELQKERLSRHRNDLYQATESVFHIRIIQPDNRAKSEERSLWPVLLHQKVSCADAQSRISAVLYS